MSTTTVTASLILSNKRTFIINSIVRRQYDVVIVDVLKHISSKEEAVKYLTRRTDDFVMQLTETVFS